MYIKDSSLNPMSELTLTIIILHIENSLLNEEKNSNHEFACY